MTVAENTAKVQEQVISAIHATQETVLTAFKPFVSLTEPLWDAASSLPFAEQFPSPTEAVEQWYGFASEALSAQKDLVLSLAGLLATTPAAKPAKAPASKAA